MPTDRLPSRWLSHVGGAALIGVALLVSGPWLSGCSSGGTGIPEAAIIPFTTCSLTQFAPNYATNTLDHWTHMPVRVLFDSDVSFTGSGTTSLSAKAISESGFNEWVTKTNGLVSYTEVAAGAPTDIEVTFNTLPAAPTNGQERGETDFTVIGTQLESAHIIIDVWPGMTVDDVQLGLQTTAAHEFGHALGISLHSANPDDVMYPAAATNVSVMVSTRDANTIKTIYGCNPLTASREESGIVRSLSIR